MEGIGLQVVAKKNLVDVIGYRVALELDDRSKVTGRLLSVSKTGNVILSDAERRFLVKRRRSGDAGERIRNECYLSVLFVRGSSVVSAHVTKGITTDPHTVDSIGGIAPQVNTSSRVIQEANMSPLA